MNIVKFLKDQLILFIKKVWKIITMIGHGFLLFFAFSPTKHCDRLDWDKYEDERTLKKDQFLGTLFNTCMKSSAFL